MQAEQVVAQRGARHRRPARVARAAARSGRAASAGAACRRARSAARATSSTAALGRARDLDDVERGEQRALRRHARRRAPPGTPASVSRPTRSRQASCSDSTSTPGQQLGDGPRAVAVALALGARCPAAAAACAAASASRARPSAAPQSSISYWMSAGDRAVERLDVRPQRAHVEHVARDHRGARDVGRATRRCPRAGGTRTSCPRGRPGRWSRAWRRSRAAAGGGASTSPKRSGSGAGK